MSDESEKRINLGRLVAEISISIIDTNMSILGPRKLLDRTFESDLSEFHISNEKDEVISIFCPLGHENPPDTKFCGICGRSIQ
jgi:hypothetical protein